MRVDLLGIGIVAPGLGDWSEAAAILRGEQPYLDAPIKAPLPARLSPNERRRSTLATRLALEAARQARSNGAPPQEEGLLSVFASSDGDMDLIDRMCRSIYEEHDAPSPTVFQNSVHNAVAGYWSIGTGCRQPSTSIAAGDGSFAAGLLEAATLVVTRSRPSLLVAFDVPAPELLHPHRTFCCPFSCAMLLAPVGTRSDPVVTLEIAPLPDAGAAAPTPMGDGALETMRTGNPAARALPLLAAIAAAGPRRLRLPYWPDLQLEIALEPRR